MLRHTQIIIFSLILTTSAAGQDIPTDFWPAQHLSVLHDFGYYWSVNSVFKPYRWERVWQQVQNDGVAPNEALGWIIHDLVAETDASAPVGLAGQDTLNFRWWNGLLLQQATGEGRPFSDFAGTPYSNLTVWFRGSLHVQLYLRVTSDPASLPHFTGEPRDIRRFGINSAEFDLASIGYHNSWLTAQFGRGRQTWGPLESGNLVLSSSSAAYDHLLFEGRYKHLKFRFFYGFLESINSSDNLNINRYLVGHGIEYSNGRNLMIGATEVTVLSGQDRPLDLAYFNPLLPVVEVELNDRTNKDRGTASSNSLWSVMLDWMPFAGWRFSGIYTIDEFQFDQADRKEGRPDALAYQFRVAHSRTLGRVAATLSFDYTRVGTFTFRHIQSGFNNFVSRGLPIGNAFGSDADRWQLGLRALLPQRVILAAAFGRQRVGERNLLHDSYEPYSDETFLSGPFPSGQVQAFNFLEWRLGYQPQRNIEIAVSGHLTTNIRNLSTAPDYVVFSANAYLPVWFGL